MKISEEVSGKLHRLLENSERIAVSAHVRPDGDALGSTCAMKSFLEDVMGKKARVVLPDFPPVTLGFLSSRFEIEAGPEAAADAYAWCDLLICLDFNVFSRIGELEQTARACKAPKVLIDHHLNPEREMFDVVISEPKISSTCELLFHTLKNLPEVAGDAKVLPSDCAYALMVGMTTDTNNFANSVFPSTLLMASELLEAGVDREDIIQRLYNDGRRERVCAWSWILSNKLRILDCGVAYMVLTAEEKEALGTLEGELEGLVNIPLQIKEVRISAFLREDGDHFQVSLRSKPGTVVNVLAGEHFHGGGHAQASGGKIFFPGDIPSRDGVCEYFETVAARFVQNK